MHHRFDVDHSLEEDRFMIIGVSESGRLPDAP